jgi:malto-oligosyltrehalose trehalohydrolase
MNMHTGQKRFAYERTWGAELMRDGAARFRLWAPATSELSLFADDNGTDIPMHRGDDGWFEIETDAVQPGNAYSFLLPSGQRVPDPAAREQVGDVHGPSRLVDPRAYAWCSGDWRGRPWEEVIIYELHTGTFTSAGTFAGIAQKLDYIQDLGVTAIELMPVAQFSGNRGWGYDGVLLYAPHTAYGGARGLKALIDAAHERGLMVLLDVVYNHFGPDGNYISLYAPEFFHREHRTPWGAGIAYDRRPVRDFLIDNALYWLEEFRLDGLRFDAIDQIADHSTPTIIEEIATAVRRRITDRHIHLTTEDDRNIAHLHERDASGAVKLCDGEWNDDFHHAAHILATADSDGYYRDYCDDPAGKLARALTEGFIYQGEPSPYRDNTKRGVPSAHLPSTAFVNFLQNHDQTGNRAFGERLALLASEAAVDALTAVLLLAPHTPLLFMGEEWGETRPFCYFTDFHGDLGHAVREGRRNEFAKWAMFQAPSTRDGIPDPNTLATFESSRLDWGNLERTQRRGRLDLTKRLLELRRRLISPRLKGLKGNAGEIIAVEGTGLIVAWRLGDSSRLTLAANLGNEPWSMPEAARACIDAIPQSALLHETPVGAVLGFESGTLQPWTSVFLLETAEARGR